MFRQKVRKNQRLTTKIVICHEKQATKMLKLINEKFWKLEVGITVRVPTPDVDRARGSSHALLVVIISYENDIYKLCKTILISFLKNKH